MHRLAPILYAASMVVSLCAAANATPHRGVWFWNTTKVDGVDSPHSSKFVVGDPALEDEAIGFMSGFGVKEVYGSYQNRPIDEPDKIQDWNAKLHAADIESQLLISGFEEFDPLPLTDPAHSNLLNKVMGRLILFNDMSTPAQQFDALHLDLEPQTLAAWHAGDEAVKRAFLDDLLDAYIDIRAKLDAEGYAALPIYADIPFTWDKMPPPSAEAGSIGWADTADRDAWFAAIGVPLEGLTIMTFSKDNLPDLATATLYERTGPFPGDVQVGIQAKVEPGEIWETYPIFDSIVTGLEDAYGEAHIENYAFWRHAHADFGPILATSGVELTGGGSVSGGGVIIFTGSPGYIYTVKQSASLHGKWDEMAQLRVQGGRRQQMRLPVKLDGRRGFWDVAETPEILDR